MVTKEEELRDQKNGRNSLLQLVESTIQVMAPSILIVTKIVGEILKSWHQYFHDFRIFPTIFVTIIVNSLITRIEAEIGKAECVRKPP